MAKSSTAYIGATKPTGNVSLVEKTPPEALQIKISTVEISTTDTPDGGGTDTFTTTAGARLVSIKARDSAHTVFVENADDEYFTIFPGQVFNLTAPANIEDNIGIPPTTLTFYSEDADCVVEIIEQV